MKITYPVFFSLTAVILILSLTSVSHQPAYSQDISFEMESGMIWFGRNDVRIPNDGGTEFDMINLIGTDPAPFFRFRLNVTFNERHTFRALLAPLRKVGTGSFDVPVIFEDTTFDADVPIDGTYRFNTYRLTYRYTFYDRNNWTLGAGVAGLIRDAEVLLDQPDKTDSSTDVGFVPLLHLYVQRDFSPRVSLVLDGESLVGPQGRATDAALTLNISLTDNWDLNAGYRILEGGADVDEVYNFALINFGLIGVKVNL